MEKVFFNPVFIKRILDYACPLNLTDRIKRYSLNDAFHETISVYGDHSDIVPKNKKILKIVPWLGDAAEKNMYIKSIYFRKIYKDAISDFGKSWFSLDLKIDLKKTRMTCSIYWFGNAKCSRSRNLRDNNKIDFETNNSKNIELFCKHAYELKEKIYKDMLALCENF